MVSAIKKITTCRTIVILLIFCLNNGLCQDFGYDGVEGPKYWGQKYSQCVGKHQSPINIEEHNVENVNLLPMKFENFDMKPDIGELKNNGHTVVLTLKSNGSQPLPIISGGPLLGRYQFVQLHFHWGVDDNEGSENKINNSSYPMELHMVFFQSGYGSFRDAIEHPDGLTVLSFLYANADFENKKYKPIIDALPALQNSNTSKILDHQIPTFDDLLMLNRSIYYTYGGSLTTPPCSEVVTWIEFVNTIPLTHNQPKITRNDRFAQMSHQEMVIEQKKREILAKIEQKQKGSATTTATTTSVTPSNPPPAKVAKVTIPNPSLFTFNTFSNDGSFLDQFKQLKEKKPETRPRIIIKNSNSNRSLDKEKKLTDAKSARWPGSKDCKTTSRVSRFNERAVPQFDCKMSISTTYSNNIDKNNIDNPQTVVSNTTTVSPQAVTGQPLLKNALMSSKLTNKLQRHQRNVIINDINLLSNLQQNQVNINRVISTINDINMGINKNINVMANISTPSMILSVPPPSVLVSISEPPPLLNQTTLNRTVNLAPNQSLLPDPQHQISVLAPLPPPPLPNISPVLPLPPNMAGLTAPGIPTLELSSIPPPNPIQIRNIPQPEPLNTLSIPPPAPLQVQNIPPPSPLQLTEIPNPKPMDLMNIPTPAEGLSADFITSIPPPNKCVPPPSVDISSTVNVNVSVPPPTTTVVAAVGATMSHLPPNISIPPPMKQPPPPTLQQTIQQQVMLPPPPPPLTVQQQQQQQQQQQSQARLVTTTPPPMTSLNNSPLLSIPTNSIPALMAHPVLPPPPPSPQQSTTAQLLVQQHQQQQALNAALNAVGSLIGPSVPPPPLNMSCPPPPTAAALMAADFERARAETMHHHGLLQQVQKMRAQQVGLAPSGGQPLGAQATALPFVLNTNTVFTAGSVEFEVMAQMARVVARCGNSVQDVLLQRKPRDADLWFLHQPHDSPIYRQYQQLVEQFRAELQGDLNAHSANKTATTDNNGAALLSTGTDNYRPEDIYDPDEAIADEDCVSGIGGPGFGSTSGGRDEFIEDNSFAFSAGESAEDRRRRKRKSRWGGQSAFNSLSTPSIIPQIPTLHSMPQTMLSFPTNVTTSTIHPHNITNNPMLTKLIRTDPALLQYAQQTFGSTNLSEEDWKKAEDHYKINLLYQDMLRKRQEVERLQKAGKFKYDYDSDEELDEVGGTWEHRLREKEMTATNLWAAELTKQAEGKHHIGDFLPPEEYKKFMEKSQAAREGRTPDISDYKEFKLKEDNVGFKMLQKLGWSEGQGLGAGGTGIVEPVNKSSQRDLNQGLGVGDESMVSNDDDEYDSYRKRMMLAYRFRPNPLNLEQVLNGVPEVMTSDYNTKIYIVPQKMSYAVTIRSPAPFNNISSDYINNNNENERHKEKRQYHNNRFPKNNRQQSYPKRYNIEKSYQYDCCNYNTNEKVQCDYGYTSVNKMATTIYDNNSVHIDKFNGDYQQSPGNESTPSPTGTLMGVTNASMDVAYDKLNFDENSFMNNKFSNSAPCVFYTTFNCSMWNSKNRYRAKSREPKACAPDAVNRRIFGLMERFSSRSHIFRTLSENKSILDGSIYDNISQPMWDIYQAHAQNETVYLKKLDIWKMVYLQISNRLDKFGLYLVGSTMSGLGMENSDIDMCLLVRQLYGDSRLNALYYLQGIHNELIQSSFIASSQVIQAKVPILKFRDNLYGFEVDLNCNNSVGIRNTHLLNCYGRMDWRVRPMVVVVKLWAQQNNINDAKCMTVSSYSLALMVIHYLQCGVKPPVIPCLHGLYPQRFNAHQDIPGIDITEELPPFHSDNNQPLGELFLGLLRYYAQFDYENYAISVREGCRLPKEECRFARSVKNDIGQWKLLCIEEPFDRSNTARSVYDPIIFDRVKKVFRNSYERLMLSRNLYSLFGVGITTPYNEQMIINTDH